MSINSSPAIVFDASYVKSRKSILQASGTVSRAAAAAAAKAANLAVESGRLFEIQDLAELRKSAPSSIAREAVAKALRAVFGIAFGSEGSDKRGNTVYTVRRADCKPEHLAEADKSVWRARHEALKDLDSVRVRILADKSAPDLDKLQAAAVKAILAYYTAGGSEAALKEAVKSAQADAAKA